MKILPAILTVFLGINSLFGADHYPSLNINLTPNKSDYSHLNLFHQSNFVTQYDDFISIQGNYKPYLDKTHSLDLGVGIRKFDGKFGCGFNMFYSTNNNLKFFAHQFSPGWEIFFGPVQISLNQYHPKFSLIKYKKAKYHFHGVSEIGITYKPIPKFEIGVYPFFNHNTRKWNLNSRVAGFISNSIEFEIATSVRENKRGITFSIGINFGGPKPHKNQSIRKNSYFVYEKFERNSNRINSPAVLPPVPKLEIPDISPPELEKELPQDLIPMDIPVLIPKQEDLPPPPPPSMDWSAFFFGVNE